MLDGLLLLGAAYWTGNLLLGALGVAFLLLAVALAFYWRWYRRTVLEMDRARQDLKAEVEELRRLVRR